MDTKQTKTTTRKPKRPTCKLDGESFDLVAVTHGTATISKDGRTCFVSVDAIEPTSKAAKDLIANA